MPEHREAFLYEHYAPRLIEEANDPVGAYLAAEVERQFNEHFPAARCKPQAAASDRPALVASAPSTSVGHDSQTHEPMEQA